MSEDVREVPSAGDEGTQSETDQSPTESPSPEAGEPVAGDESPDTGDVESGSGGDAGE